MFDEIVIHYWHLSGEIIGYAHNFCNRKLKENEKVIPVFAHNLFSYDFFFVAKGIRLCVWRMKSLNIAGTNLTNVQYANIGNQVKYIDTIKYDQQSLSSLTSNTDETERLNIKSSCEKFIRKHSLFSKTFDSISDEEKGWIVDYLLGKKEVIPYEMIRSYEDLDAAPPRNFSLKLSFIAR